MKFKLKEVNRNITDEEMLNDLKMVAEKFNTDTLTQKLYSENGKYDVTTISRRFDTWNKALKKAELMSGNISNYSDEELFLNILEIWQHKGNQPSRRDLAVFPSKISQSPYNRRFSTWMGALEAFIKYINADDEKNSNEKEDDRTNGLTIKENGFLENKHKTKRDINLRLRFLVMKRDNFKCCNCGASPSKDSNVELHIDHIIPWSKGGETEIDNLQTLCSKCNLGKSNIE